MVLDFLIYPILFLGGGLVLMATVGVAWGIIEDWARERRWNRYG